MQQIEEVQEVQERSHTQTTDFTTWWWTLQPRRQISESGGERGVFRVSNRHRKQRKHQLHLLSYTMKGFNEQLHAPSGDPRCYKSRSISVPFHPAPLLQTWHSLFFPSPRRERKTLQLLLFPPPFKWWVYFGWGLNQSPACADSNFHHCM